MTRRKSIFRRTEGQQHGDRTVLTAAIPPGFIRKAVAASPSEAAPETPQPAWPPVAKARISCNLCAPAGVTERIVTLSRPDIYSGQDRVGYDTRKLVVND